MRIGLYLRGGLSKEEEATALKEAQQYCKAHRIAATQYVFFGDSPTTLTGALALGGQLKSQQIDYVISAILDEYAEIILTVFSQSDFFHGAKKVFHPHTGKQNMKTLAERIQKKVSSEHGLKISAGIAIAKERGKSIGAPKGNTNKKNKRKTYDRQQIEQLSKLLKENVPFRKIVEQVPFDITIGTISNIKRKLDSGEITFSDEAVATNSQA